MDEKSRSNDDVYDEWINYIKKRNSFFKKADQA
jgi:hypothetical protein